MKSLQSHENNPKRTRKTLSSQEQRNSLILRQYTNDIMIAQLQAHHCYITTYYAPHRDDSYTQHHRISVE